MCPEETPHSLASRFWDIWSRSRNSHTFTVLSFTFLGGGRFISPSLLAALLGKRVGTPTAPPPSPPRMRVIFVSGAGSDPRLLRRLRQGHLESPQLVAAPGSQPVGGGPHGVATRRQRLPVEGVGGQVLGLGNALGYRNSSLTLPMVVLESTSARRA